jgi:hypothetical protein
MPAYVKHLIECNCVLKQFEAIQPTVWHKFVVFSVVDDNGDVKPSYAKCNNCQGIHRVTEVGVAEKLKKESSPTLPDIEELKTGLPEKLVSLLAKYTLDVSTWQEIRFLYDNEQWGKPVVLDKETEDGETHGKYLLLVGKTLWKIDSFSTEDI